MNWENDQRCTRTEQFMAPNEDNQQLRPFEAVIWKPDLESVGFRATFLATDLDDAKRQLEAEHGAGCVYTLHNEDDAAKPRE